MKTYDNQPSKEKVFYNQRVQIGQTHLYICKHREDYPRGACQHEWVDHWCSHVPENICIHCDLVQPKEADLCSQAIEL